MRRIAINLESRGVIVWLDEWRLAPGQLWAQALEKEIESIRSVAVFVGANGIGPWQNQEIYAFLNEFVRRGCPVIPVILRSAKKVPDLPVFLRGFTWVDFRRKNPHPIEQLIWGIRGVRASPHGCPVRRLLAQAAGVRDLISEVFALGKRSKISCRYSAGLMA